MTSAAAQKIGRPDGGAPPMTGGAAQMIGRPTAGRLP